MIVLLILNAVVAIAGVAFSLIGGFRPEALSESGKPTAGERFYGWMYATRGVPLGVTAGLAPLVWTVPATVLLLLAAAAAQVGDVTIGVATRKWTMIAGASVATAVHVVTAVAVR
ncbi:hypothetical protein [Cryptosporangium sp. NPDC051539]|uniref:hypothetical protein n=1 Tax=Cryptosporangium sp. NPDC051539 TaxID=3363962 RepID=UPI0037A03BF4